MQELRLNGLRYDEQLRIAAVHHWRARMHVKLSHQYTSAVWDSMPLPRKFFTKHRGFGPTHTQSDLPLFRKMFLRCAFSSAERAVELAPQVRNPTHVYHLEATSPGRHGVVASSPFSKDKRREKLLVKTVFTHLYI